MLALLDILDGADQIERLLGQIRIGVVENALAAGQGVFQGDAAAALGGELLCGEEGLRQKAFQPPRLLDGGLVFARTALPCRAWR